MFGMVKWAALLASLKQKNYKEASKEVDDILDYDDLQDALQVIPFKALNQDLPENLQILEKLYTKFILLTSDKDEGRLILRHVFKVDVLLHNVIRLRVEKGILGRTADKAINKDSVDHITQITWNIDANIIKELMTRSSRLNSTLKHLKKTSSTSQELGLTSDEIKTELKCGLAKFNSVIQHLESLTQGRTPENTLNHSTDPSLSLGSLSLSKVETAKCGDTVERIRSRCKFNQEVLDVLEPCEGNIERGPVLLKKLKDLVQNDLKFLQVTTELSIDISSSCYRDFKIEKILEHFITSHKSVLSAVAYDTVNGSPSNCQRSITKTHGNSNSCLVNNGLKIDVNGLPLRSRLDTRRLSARDQKERREPFRTHSHRERRPDTMVDDCSSNVEGVQRLKEKLALREKQLEETKSLVKNLKKREEQLLEKLTEQAKNYLMNSEKFENISEDTPRVDHLVKQYDDLYSQLRLEALDDLDNIAAFDSLERSDEIKSQITFAIITVSFHMAQQEIENRRRKIYSLLHMDDKLSRNDCSSLRNEISLQLRRSAPKIDLQQLVEEVCNGLCATMFDFPELQSCEQLRRFVEACVRFSWSICAQVPPLTINYESKNFTSSLHSKSHNSDEGCDTVRYHVWPALIESEKKTVLYKGVVTT